MSQINYIFERLYQISGLESFSWLQVFYFILIIIGALIIELIAVGWKRSSFLTLIKFEKTTRTDFYIWLTELFGLFNILAFLSSLGISYFLVGQIQKSVDLQLIRSIDNSFLQFLIVFLLSDFKEYIKHYLFHRVPALWEIHAFHHSAEKFNMLTAYRFHYLQTALGTFLDVIPYVILGVPIQTYFAVKIVSTLHGLLIHSNLKHNWGFVGRYILVSPASHRLHHSIKPEHFDKNFAGKFIFWDRLFGTYHPPVKIDAIGIPNNTFNKKNLLYDLYRPVYRMFRKSN